MQTKEQLLDTLRTQNISNKDRLSRLKELYKTENDCSDLSDDLMECQTYIRELDIWINRLDKNYSVETMKNVLLSEILSLGSMGSQSTSIVSTMRDRFKLKVKSDLYYNLFHIIS